MKACSCFTAALLVLALSTAAIADIPNPNRRQQNQNPVNENRAVAPVVVKHGPIRGEGRSVQAKIIIPRALLPGDAGQAVGAPAPTAPAPAAPAPRFELIPPKPQTGSNTPPLGTAIAGIAMSLAAVSLVFVVRGNRVTKAAALIVLSGGLVATGWGIAHADIAGQKRPIRPGPVDP